MLTPTLSGTIMRRQHGARNIFNGASRLGPACCCLIIEYVMHGDCVACTISTEEQQNTGRSMRGRGRKRRRLQFVKILPANKKQIKADQRQMKLPSRGYTTLKCTFASNTHSFSRSLTHSFTHSVSQSFISVRFGACDNKSLLPLVPFPALLLCSSPALLFSFAAANFRLKLIERPTR